MSDNGRIGKQELKQLIEDNLVSVEEIEGWDTPPQKYEFSRFAKARGVEPIASRKLYHKDDIERLGLNLKANSDSRKNGE